MSIGVANRVHRVQLRRRRNIVTDEGHVRPELVPAYVERRRHAVDQDDQLLPPGRAELEAVAALQGEAGSSPSRVRDSIFLTP